MSAVRLARALCAAAIAFELAFVSPAWSGARVLWYLPLAHRWIFGDKPSQLAMDWYGRTLLASVAALVVFALARIPRREPRDTSIALFTGWLAMAVAMTLGLQVFQLVTRHPVPEPLPRGYVPR